METEYVLWGLPQGSTDHIDARVLATDNRPLAYAARFEQIKELAARDGWHTFRVQAIDGTLPDFAGTVQI